MNNEIIAAMRIMILLSLAVELGLYRAEALIEVIGEHPGGVRLGVSGVSHRGFRQDDQSRAPLLIVGADIMLARPDGISHPRDDQEHRDDDRPAEQQYRSPSRNFWGLARQESRLCQALWRFRADGVHHASRILSAPIRAPCCLASQIARQR